MLAQVEQDIAETVNLLNRVVVNERRSHGAGFDAQSEALHKPGGIEMAVSNSNVRGAHRFRNLRWSNTREIETESSDAFSHSFFRADAIHGRAALVQHSQHLERERLLVLTNRFHRSSDVATA